MKVVLANQKHMIVELDTPFQILPNNPNRLARYIAIDMTRDIEYFKKIRPCRLASSNRLAVFDYPVYEHTNIEQQDFPDKLLDILKAIGILNDDGTVNTKTNK